MGTHNVEEGEGPSNNTPVWFVMNQHFSITKFFPTYHTHKHTATKAKIESESRMKWLYPFSDTKTAAVQDYITLSRLLVNFRRRQRGSENQTTWG
jgi:hypothetical protein